MWGFFTSFVNYFVHNVSATVSYGRKERLDIRTAIKLDKYFFNNKQDSHDILQTPGRADISVIRKRKRHRYRGRRAPQTDAFTKSALSQLYKEISKEETTHPEAALLVAGDFNAGTLK